MHTATPPIVDLSKYIELRDDRPCIRGRRLPVAFIAAAYHTNQLSIAETAYQFTLSEEQVLAALLYYRENQEQIDAQDTQDTHESLEMHKRYGNQSDRS